MASRILQAGIDEAGYAPRLGPLVATGVCIERPEAEADLYNLLAPVVSRSAPRGRALHVADSKQVHDPSKGLAALERSVLPFLRIALEDPSGGGRASTDLSLADGLAAAPLALEELAWYAGEPLGLPLAAETREVSRSTVALDERLRAANLTGLHIRAKVVTARELNAGISQGANKAELLLGWVAGLMAGLLEPVTGTGEAESPDRAVVIVDRLGGRADYRGLLEKAFPGVPARELSKGRRLSSYLLEGRDVGWRCSVAFACEAESLCLTVALASMTSKYLRELLMNRLNRYFTSRLPRLQATAGYPQDAARFLSQTAGLREDQRIRDADFVRSR